MANQDDKQRWLDHLRVRTDLLDEMLRLDCPSVLLIRQAQLIMQAAINLDPDLAREIMSTDLSTSSDSYRIAEIKLLAPEKPA
jgi:hypothetical protein